MSFRTRLSRFSTSALTFAIFVSVTLFAQQPKVLAPHKPIPPLVLNPKPFPNPPTPQSMVGGLWMTDANFKSSIYLKNNVETDPITVTPILWLSNGKKLVLNEVKLDPAGVAVVSINQSLADHGIAFWATLSGYVEIQYTWPWNALCVTVEDIDVSHSLVHTYGLRASSPDTPLSVPPGSAQTQIFAGLWWKQ
jgi:hypothetical protein